MTSPLQYCWRKTNEECNHFRPINLHINIAPLESNLYMITKATLKPGERLSSNMFSIDDTTPLALIIRKGWYSNILSIIDIS